ncbi:MAG: hypothetical protein AB7V27_17655 [Candidatus Binatia bacterium]
MTEPDTHGTGSGTQVAHYRNLRQQLEELAASVQELSVGAEAWVGRWLGPKPYATLAAAAGLGYVLGGGLPNFVVRQAFKLTARLTAALLIARFLLDNVNTGRTAPERHGRDDRPQ